MNVLIYSIVLSRYGVIYLDTIKGADGSKIIYGYSKSANQYSFWKVNGYFSLSLLEICNSRSKAVFSYKVLSKGM